MKCGLFLDVVVRKSSAILELLSSEDKSLLIWGNSFLILDLSLDIFNGVSWFDIKGDSLSSKGLDEDLHTTSKSQNEMKGRLFLNVVIWKSSTILELLSGKDKSLLIWWDSFLILDFSFDIFNCVCWFNIKSDGFSSKGFDEDLHTSSKSQNKMESWFFLDVVVWESSSIFKLLSSKNESLLIWRNTFLVLDLGFDILNSICWFNIESDGFTSESLDKDLHTTSKSEYEMESGLFLDVVVTEGSSIFKLLSGEDKSLLIWWDTFFVLDLSLDVFNWVCWLNIKGDGLSSKSLYENLHTTSKSEDQVEGWLFLDVIVGESSAIFELFTGKDESLLIWRNTFLILDLCLDIFDWICWFNIKSDGFTCECFDENLHFG